MTIFFALLLSSFENNQSVRCVKARLLLSFFPFFLVFLIFVLCKSSSPSFSYFFPSSSSSSFSSSASNLTVLWRKKTILPSLFLFCFPLLQAFRLLLLLSLLFDISWNLWVNFKFCLCYSIKNATWNQGVRIYQEPRKAAPSPLWMWGGILTRCSDTIHTWSELHNKGVLLQSLHLYRKKDRKQFAASFPIPIPACRLASAEYIYNTREKPRIINTWSLPQAAGVIATNMLPTRSLKNHMFLCTSVPSHVCVGHEASAARISTYTPYLKAFSEHHVF